MIRRFEQGERHEIAIGVVIGVVVGEFAGKTGTCLLLLQPVQDRLSRPISLFNEASMYKR